MRLSLLLDLLIFATLYRLLPTGGISNG